MKNLLRNKIHSVFNVNVTWIFTWKTSNINLSAKRYVMIQKCSKGVKSHHISIIQLIGHILRHLHGRYHQKHCVFTWYTFYCCCLNHYSAIFLIQMMKWTILRQTITLMSCKDQRKSKLIILLNKFNVILNPI